MSASNGQRHFHLSGLKKRERKKISQTNVFQFNYGCQPWGRLTCENLKTICHVCPQPSDIQKAEWEVLCSCVLRLRVCPYSYSLIGQWQERLAEVNSGKRIYHSAVALNAFQMMCPWNARLLLSSPPAWNSLWNCRYYWMCLTTKKVLLTCAEFAVTQKVCLPSDIIVKMNFPEIFFYIHIENPKMQVV